jgi:hypothetical protein
MGLPDEKVKKLSEKVADSIKKAVKTDYDDMRKHEVSRSDADRIIRDGFSKAGRVTLDELDKDAPEKPRS